MNAPLNAQMVLLDRADIACLLPHRHPILLPLRAEIHQPGQAGRAWARLHRGEPLCFGDDALALQGPLLLETAAQTLGLVLGTGQGSGDRDERHLLLGFDQVMFSEYLLADGEEFEVAVVRSDSSGATHVATFIAQRGDVVLAKGQMMVMKG